MTIERVDARFLLPFDLDGGTRVAAGAGWAEVLAAAGVPAAGTGTNADVAAGSLEELAGLLASNPRAVLVEGDARRDLRRAGYQARAFVALPDPQHLRVVLAPQHRAAAAYGMRARVNPTSRLKRLRRDAAAGTMRYLGLVPPSLPLVSIGQREAAPPFLVAAAERELGVHGLGWFLVTGTADVLSRNVYFLFRRRAQTPEWVLKFARVPTYDAPFHAEEAALREAVRLGPVVTAHVPATATRFAVGGRPAVIEAAAPGRRLDTVVNGPGRESDKVAAIERVLEWLLQLASASRAPREAVAGEWRRLQALVRPISLPLPREPFFDPVLQHNDLGGWNVIVDAETFTVVDWELSRRHGAPLWDLWYFLVHLLPVLAGVGSTGVDAYVRRLLRGEDRWSDLLFRWTRRAAAEAGVDRRDLGTLATLCWLHHAGTRPAKAALLKLHAPEAQLPELLIARLPEIWLGDEGLGPEWRCLDR